MAIIGMIPVFNDIDTFHYDFHMDDWTSSSSTVYSQNSLASSFSERNSFRSQDVLE